MPQRRRAVLATIVTAIGLNCPAATPPARVPEGMVRIPAGEFLMGKDGSGDWSPSHNVRLRAFDLDAHEVTNAMYLKFCQSTGHALPEFWGMEAFHSGPGFPNHPVTGVSWGDAAAYAAWAGKRLPTEAEWEYAARGGLAGMEYPSGNAMSDAAANFGASGKRKGTLPVSTYPPNGFGLYDMSGNVCEWVADFYGGYRADPGENPAGPEEGRFKVIRGGGWHSGPSCVCVYYRNALPANWVDFNVGFRCASDAR